MSKIVTYSIVMVVLVISGILPIFVQETTNKIIPAKFVDVNKDPAYYLEGIMMN